MKTTLTVSGITATVYYTVHPGSRGSRDSLGGIRGAGPPPEPEVEIESIASVEPPYLPLCLTPEQEELFLFAVMDRLSPEG